MHVVISILRYYMLAANCTAMLIVPFVSLLVLNWKIHSAIKRREAFKASLGQASISLRDRDHHRQSVRHHR
jgi:hypothetical protein